MRSPQTFPTHASRKTNEMQTNSKLVTIERFINSQQPSEASGDLTNLLFDIALAARLIAQKTSRAGMSDLLLGPDHMGSVGSITEQESLDVYADSLLFQLCDHNARVCIMASEEHEFALEIPQEFEKGKYVLIFDPLDGTSNMDVNISVGTIFSIHRCVDWKDRGRVNDCLQPARDLVAAGYVIYGASTMLVYSTGNGVHGFILDPQVGEFILAAPNIRIPEIPSYYSVNYANARSWTPGMQRYVDWLGGNAPDSPNLSQRYVGSLVADFHRNLLKGGVFAYPADSEHPEGKLRLLYEAGPLAFIAEQAGGAATDGSTRILEMVPEHLHQRIPLILGNKNLVERARQYDRVATNAVV